MTLTASDLAFRYGKFPEYRGVRRHLGADAAHTLDAMELALPHHASKRDAILRDYAASIGVEAQDIRSFIGSLTIALEGTSKVQGASDLRKDLKERDIEALIGWRSTDPVILSAPHHESATDESGAVAHDAQEPGKKSGKKPEERSENLGENWLPAAIDGRRARLASEDRSHAAIEQITKDYAAAYRTSPTAMRNLNVPLKGHCRLLAAGSKVVNDPAYLKSHAAALVAGRWPSSDIPGAVAAAERYIEHDLEWSVGQSMLKAAWKLGEAALGKTYERSPDDHPEFDILDRPPQEEPEEAPGEAPAIEEVETGGPAPEETVEDETHDVPAEPAPGNPAGLATAPPDEGDEDPAASGLDEFARMALRAASAIAGKSLRIASPEEAEGPIETIHATDGRVSHKVILVRPGLDPSEYAAIRRTALGEAAYRYLEGSVTIIAITPEGDAAAMAAEIQKRAYANVWTVRVVPSFRTEIVTP